MRIILCIFVLLAPCAAGAWGVVGHCTIGEMSERLLTDEARRKVTAVLGNASLAMVSNWADNVRSDSAWSYAETWHYTNLDSGLSRASFDTAAVSTHSGQCVFRVMSLIDHLKQQPNDTSMLKMLVHLMQDMHCPLHMGHASDRGGNSVYMQWFGRRVSLHSIWDSGMIEGQHLSYTEYANHLMRVNRLQRLTFSGSHRDVLDWAYGIFQTLPVVYGSALSFEKKSSYSYVYYHKPLYETCLVQSAERLAAVLNYLYSE